MRRLLRSLFFQLRSLFRNGNKQAELDEEMDYHVDRITQDLIEEGMSPEVAKKAALKEFGNVEFIKENSRDSWGTQMITGMVKEFRLGLRLLWKNKGFTLAVVLTLALCIAGNTVVFTIQDEVLGPPSYPNPDRVVQIYNTYPGIDGKSTKLGGLSNRGCYVDYYRNADLLESVAIVEPRDVNISMGDTTIRSSGIYVTRQFFDLVGFGPLLGRYFIEEEFQPQNSQGFPIILAEPYWRNQFGGDPDILGKTIYLNSMPNTVIGIAPRHVGTHFGRPDFYRVYSHSLMFPQEALDRLRHTNSVYLWGRIKDGVSIGQAKAQIKALDQRFFERADSNMQEFLTHSKHVTELATYQQILRSNEGRLIYLLQGSVLLVLLIGCLNVANLLLARGFGRKSEFALRSAIGAPRIILVRQLLVEGMVLAFASCLFGYFLTWSIVGLVEEYLLTDLMVDLTIESLSISGASAVFLIGVSLSVGLLLGLFSSVSLLFSKGQLMDPIHEGSSKSTSSKSMRRLRSSLVAAQVGLSIVLLVGASLLIQSFLKATNIDPGIDKENLYVSKVGLAWGKYGRGKDGGVSKANFHQQLKPALLEIPGIESVAFTSYLPTLDDVGQPTRLGLPGLSDGSEAELKDSYLVRVPMNFFDTFGIKQLRGRRFDIGDTNRQGYSVIIDRTFAERYFKDEDPVGKYISRGDTPDPATTPIIVGVVENIKHLGLDNRLSTGSSEFLPLMYLLEKTRDLDPNFNIIFKTNRPFSEVFGAIQEKVRALDHQLPLYQNQSMESLMRGSIDDRRAFMLLITILSTMALALSAIGIYGVLAYDLTQRTREFGLRMALGATRVRILELVFRQNVIKVGLGMSLGLICAYLLSDRISDFLFQVEPTEPLAFISVAVFVATIAFLATYLPARRASRIQPMEALRTE